MGEHLSVAPPLYADHASTGGVGSSAEQSQIAMILAEITGKTPTSNGLNDLLLGPMLRGMVVLR